MNNRPGPAVPLHNLLWNAYARHYDAIVELAPYQAMLDEVIDALKLAPGMRVLDAGCGTGALANRLADRFPDIELVGVDLSRGMLERAKRRRAWPPGFAFVEGEIATALHDSRGFDRIASVNVVWTLPDPGATFSAMAASMPRGGRMVHTTPKWSFGAHTIVWRHLREQKGRNLARSILRLPLLLWAGFLNLLLVLHSVLSSPAHRRWHQRGLVELLTRARVPPTEIRPCYAGQAHLIVCEVPPPQAGSRVRER